MKKFLEETGEGKKKMMTGAFGIVLLLLITLLFLNSMVKDRDGRSSIISKGDSGVYDDSSKTEEEVRLENVLESMEGVGKVHVMIRSDVEKETASVFLSGSEEKSSGEIKGVIVVAEGAKNPVTQSKITEAVATVCGIPVSSVAVYSMS